MRASLAVLLAALAPLMAAAAPAGPLHLDDFEDLAPWSVVASQDVKASLRQAPGSEGRALCLDFDFGTVSGYAVARRALPITFPGNYEITFDIRAEAPPNALQAKLLDASGENVWWFHRPDFEFPREWQPVRIKKRHVEFAWGTTAQRELQSSAALELAIARGRGGGKGSVCFDRLAMRELPTAAAPPAQPLVEASSSAPGSLPRFAVDGSAATAWRSNPAAGPEQALTADFGGVREFGALVLRWLPGLHASRYTLESSLDGAQWRRERSVSAGNGGTDPILLTDAETRYLRLRMHDGPGKAYGLAEIEVKDLAFGATPNAFFEALAREAPRGHYPRGFAGEQAYWTIVGIDGGLVQGLLSEDGALELAPGTAAVEPMLLTDEGLLTWADVATEHTLAEGYLPLPQVAWRRGELVLRVEAFGVGERARSQIIARYTVENRSPRARSVTLVLAVRPFQVNPPSQFLNVAGGVAPIRTLAWDRRGLAVDGTARIFPLTPPTEFFAAPFDAGNIPELLAAPRRPDAQAVDDAAGFASGALLYRLELPAHGAHSVAFIAPLTGAARLPRHDADAWVLARKAEAAARWRANLNRVTVRAPGAGRMLADTLRTALAHVLINRAGPALQPGARSYARSWIRDGALTSEALLRLGREDAVREFADWYAAHQFADGKVPCCVDRRGADPVAEHDSQGEWIHLVGELHRYTGDRARLERMWPGVRLAAAHMESLRAAQRTPSNLAEARRAYYGLMPPSISHEGYSDKPAYSYWDDFWALAGYRGAVDIARALGREGEARVLAGQRDEFHGDLLASIRAAVSRHGIDYIPGSADRGDFDATSTTIALAPGGERASLPAELLDSTFERYWQEFIARRDARKDWEAYTPYELRNVGAFVRLGWRERASRLLDFFMADRRPQGWNQWAEVIGRQARKPRFIGDMPHGWVASDFIRSALDLFAYERESDRSLVLAAGIPADWMNGKGIVLRGLRTPWGRLSYTLRRDGSRLELSIPQGAALPPGGLILAWPLAEAPVRVRVNGREVHVENGEIRITRLPARLVAVLGQARNAAAHGQSIVRRTAQSR